MLRALELFEITSSMREPVSVKAVARIVNEPPSSTLRLREEPLRLLHGVRIETARE